MIKDSGSRTKYETGAVRDCSVGKGRFDLIPIEPLFRVARHYEDGQVKYPPPEGEINTGEQNWKKGIPLCSYFNSAIRHIHRAMRNEVDEDHLAAAVWNILCAMETERRIEKDILPQELDNRDVEQ